LHIEADLCNLWLRIGDILAPTPLGRRPPVVPDRISREVVIDAPPVTEPALRQSNRPTPSPFAGCVGRTTNPATAHRPSSRPPSPPKARARGYADENTKGWIHELNELRDDAARLGSSPESYDR
jgi:hypothetical protein